MLNANKITVRDGQSVFDIALQYYGTLAAVFLVVEDNVDVSSVDSTLYSGQILNIRQSDPLINPATANSLSGGVGTIVSPDDNIVQGGFSRGFNRGFNV
jgi:hypothetical protein